MPFEIPTSWQWVSVEDISTSILYGVSESAKENGQYKLLRITDIQNNNVCWDTVPFTNYDKDVSNYLLEKGDILFARTGATVGKSFLIEEQLNLKAIYASYLIRVRTASDICPEYLKYFFESGYYWSQITSSSVGVGQPNVNGTSLGCLNLPLPPFKEQKRIVSTLRDYFKGAENIEKAIHSLNGNISLLKSKVLELAVTGKLVPQNPDDEPAAELLRRINPEAQIVTDNGHYPQLPQGWCYTLLQNLAKTDTGFPFDSSRFSLEPKGRKPLIRIRDIKKGYTGTFTDEDCANSYIVKYGDMLIGMDGDFNLAKWASEDALLNQRVCRIRSLNENLLLSEYLYFSLPSFLAEINGSTSSITVKHLSTRQIDNIIFPIPPINEQKRIVERIHSFLAAIDLICNSI